MALDLKQLQALLDTAQSAEQFKKDIQRALKKVGNNLSALQTSLDEVNALLSGEAEATERKPRAPRTLGVEQNPEHPYGTKPDGTPKKKPGRSKAATE